MKNDPFHLDTSDKESKNKTGIYFYFQQWKDRLPAQKEELNELGQKRVEQIKN